MALVITVRTTNGNGVYVRTIRFFRGRFVLRLCEHLKFYRQNYRLRFSNYNSKLIFVISISLYSFVKLKWISLIIAHGPIEIDEIRRWGNPSGSVNCFVRRLKRAQCEQFDKKPVFLDDIRISFYPFPSNQRTAWKIVSQPSGWLAINRPNRTLGEIESSLM